MKKLLLSAVAFLGLATLANAQFKMDNNYPIAGIQIATDSLAGIRTFVCNFNTTQPLMVPGGAAQKAQTQKGVMVKVYNELAVPTEVQGVDGKCNNYGSNGNPIHISKPDSIIKYYTSLTSGAWSLNHNFWKPAACVFNVNDPADLTNQGFGAYPGIYKKQDFRFYFNFSGYPVSSDIQFDIATLDAGNTGKTAKYKLMVSFDSDKTPIPTGSTIPDYTVTDFYTTGTKMHVSLAKALGIDSPLFSNKKVYIALYTDGTGDYIKPYYYDPVIYFDNFNVKFKLPAWIQPSTGIKANVTLDNPASAVENFRIDGNDIYFPLFLKTSGRVGALTVINNIESALHDTKQYSFLATGGIKMKDADGNYTVDVPYTYAPDVSTDGGVTWSKETMTVAAPSSSSGVNDDICVYVKHTLGASDTNGKVLSGSIELNCGTRIWNVFYGKINLTPTGNPLLKSASVNVYADGGKVFVTNASDNVSVYDVNGQLLVTISARDAAVGIPMVAGVYVIKSGSINEKVIVQ